ncbi:MAG: putative glucose/L-sorbosone dehydrogenase, distantly related to bacterial beta-galactosidase [Ferruginibacter sp.]|nr:putative glucose/L-sorbosone dehydrogenase, distantly related to bacterial beta-galactosidase [Ferruginibacter sp.]
MIAFRVKNPFLELLMNQKMNSSFFLRIVLWGLIFIQCPISPCFSNVSRLAQKKIIVRIFDEHGKPTAARIRITGKDSIYYAPEGHSADFPITEREGDLGQGGDVILDNNRRFAYVDGTCNIDLPEKETFQFEVVKGFAYRFVDRVITVSSETDSVNIQLEKWFEFPKQARWYSGDIHTHEIDSATALLSMKAEDVNVCNILISDFTTDQQSFRGAPEPISDSLHIVYLNQEYREHRLGHVNLLNLKKLIEPAATMRPYQYPLSIKAMDEAHAQGGHVSWAHFAAYPALEGPLDIVLKKVDAVEVLCTIDPFKEPVFVSDIVPDLRMNSGLRLWYRLLNCGLKIPATAGTDKMNNWVTVGANRVYALVKGNLNYQKWIEALDKGQSFITNSPMLFCTVDGKNPGEEINLSQKKPVKIVAEVSSQLPVSRLEIIANGEVIAEKVIEKGQYHAMLEIDYTPQKSVWIAARAHQYSEEDEKKGVSFAQRRDLEGGPTLLNRYYGTLRPETAFAHTNPCYVMINKQPIRSANDAQYFVRYLENSRAWLQQSGRFPSRQAKQEVLNSFEKGIQLYKELEK